ncbi:hypothetical protein ACPCHT_29195 [Nucisporomicrobium flavum]|uniref:hypothetical protein n=1 Tax=Nucisporomicrobium flavum TaxID=2785915 RepID=UPI003C2D6121
MKRALPAVVLLVLVAGGCGTDKPEASPVPASPSSTSTSPSPSTSSLPSITKAAPQPRFADLTQGSTTSVVKLHAYDGKNASAVVEPIIFMTGDAYCRTFKIKRSDSRCVNHEYVTEASHTKVTVPIAATAKYFTWEGADGNVCLDAPEKGGTCPMTAKEFAGWFKLNEGGMVAIATTDGTLTRMAIVYTP